MGANVQDRARHERRSWTATVALITASALVWSLLGSAPPAAAVEGLPTGTNVFPSSCVGDLYQTRFAVNEPICANGRVAPSPEAIISGDSTIHIVPVSAGADPSAAVASRRIVVLGTFLDEPVWLQPEAGEYHLVVDNWNTDEFTPAEGDYVYPETLVVDGEELASYDYDASAVKAQAGEDLARLEEQARGVKAGLYSTAIASVFSIGMNFHLAGLVRFGFGYRFAGWAGVAGLAAFGTRATDALPDVPLYLDYDSAVLAIGSRIIFGLYDAKAESYRQLRDDPADPDYERLEGPDLRAVEAHAAELLADDPIVLLAGDDDPTALPQSPRSDHPLVVATADLANLTADQAALTRAFMHSHERFLGARDADDLPWAVAQGRTLIDHAEALETSYRASQGVLDELADGYSTLVDPEDPGAVDGEEFAGIQAQLADGFDPQQRRNLRRSGYTQAEQEQLLDEILAVDPDEVGDGLTLETMFGERRDALDDTVAAVVDAADDMRALLAELAADFDDPNLPSVEVTVPDDVAPGAPATVTAVHDGGEGTTTLAWDLTGDGSFDDGTGSSAEVVFDRPGPHPVAVRATDERGVATMARSVVEVVQAPPTTLTGTPADSPVEAQPGDELSFSVAAPDGTTLAWQVDGEPAGSGSTLDVDVPRRPGTLVVRAEARDGDRLVGARLWSVLIDDDLDGADSLSVTLADAQVEAGDTLDPVVARLVDADGEPVARADEPVRLELERDTSPAAPGAGLDGTVEAVTDDTGTATFEALEVRQLTPAGDYRVRAVHGADRVASAASDVLTVVPPTSAPAEVDVTLDGLGGQVTPGTALGGTLRVDLDDPDELLGDEVTVELDLRDPTSGGLDDPATSVADELLTDLEASPDLVGAAQAPTDVDGVEMAITAEVAGDASDADAVWVVLVRDADGRLVGARTEALAVREPAPGDPGASVEIIGLPERVEPGDPASFELELSLEAPSEAQGDVVVELSGPRALGDGDGDASFTDPVADPAGVIDVPLSPTTFGGEGVTVDVAVDVAADAVPDGYVWRVTLADDRGVLAADQAATQIPSAPLRTPSAAAEVVETVPVTQGETTTFDVHASLDDPDEVVVDDLTLELDLRDATGEDLLDPSTSILGEVADGMQTSPEVLGAVDPADLRAAVEATVEVSVADDAPVGDPWWVLELRDGNGDVVAAGAAPQRIDAARSPSVTFVASGLEDELVPDQEASFGIEVAADDPADRLPAEIELSWDVRRDADDPDTSLVGDLFERVDASPAGFFDAPLPTHRLTADGQRVRLDVRLAFDAPLSDLDGFPLVLEAHGSDGQLLARSTADALLVGEDVRLPGTGGPVILTGIDAELGPNDCYHGCLSTWQDVLAGVLERTRNGGNGVLVIGANTGQAANWWTRVVEGYDPQGLPGLGVPVDLVDDPDEIATIDLDQYAMIGVATSTHQLSSGGITNAQNLALNARATDIATFVNRGGGVLGHTQDQLPDPYAYISGVGEITQATSASDTLEITDAGYDAGIRQDFEGCCWHTSFAQWPEFMEPLVYGVSGTRQYVQMLGGRQVGIATGIELSPVRAQAVAGEAIELQATVQEGEEPVAGEEVTFTVLEGGPHAGTVLTADTDAEGNATVTVTGEAIGEDLVEAGYLDSNGDQRVSNRATLRWRPVESDVAFDPAEAIRGIGERHTVTATVTEGGAPAPDRAVSFTVAGVHGDTVDPALVHTDDQGVATFTYTGTEVGDDVIEVTATDAMGRVWQDELDVTWQVLETCVDLLAGQHLDAGEVCITRDGDELVVDYATDDGWRLLETHVAVADSVGTFADQGWTNSPGHPAPGRFPHHGDHTSVDEVTHRIPIDDVPGYADADELVLAAHAAVVHDDGDHESAWAAGTRFSTGDPWATYATVTRP